MELHKIQSTLSENGINTIVRVIESVEEKEKSYMWKHNRLSKDKIMVCDTIFRNTLPSTSIHFEIYCLPIDSEKATALLKTKLIERYNELKNSLDSLTRGMDKININ